MPVYRGFIERRASQLREEDAAEQELRALLNQSESLKPYVTPPGVMADPKMVREAQAAEHSMRNMYDLWCIHCHHVWIQPAKTGNCPKCGGAGLHGQLRRNDLPTV